MAPPPPPPPPAGKTAGKGSPKGPPPKGPPPKTPKSETAKDDGADGRGPPTQPAKTPPPKVPPAKTPPPKTPPAKSAAGTPRSDPKSPAKAPPKGPPPKKNDDGNAAAPAKDAEQQPATRDDPPQREEQSQPTKQNEEPAKKADNAKAEGERDNSTSEPSNTDSQQPAKQEQNQPAKQPPAKKPPNKSPTGSRTTSPTRTKTPVRRKSPTKTADEPTQRSHTEERRDAPADTSNSTPPAVAHSESQRRSVVAPSRDMFVSQQAPARGLRSQSPTYAIASPTRMFLYEVPETRAREPSPIVDDRGQPNRYPSLEERRAIGMGYNPNVLDAPGGAPMWTESRGPPRQRRDTSGYRNFDADDDVDYETYSRSSRSSHRPHHVRRDPDAGLNRSPSRNSHRDRVAVRELDGMHRDEHSHRTPRRTVTPGRSRRSESDSYGGDPRGATNRRERYRDDTSLSSVSRGDPAVPPARAVVRPPLRATYSSRDFKNGLPAEVEQCVSDSVARGDRVVLSFDARPRRR